MNLKNGVSIRNKGKSKINLTMRKINKKNTNTELSVSAYCMGKYIYFRSSAHTDHVRHQSTERVFCTVTF